MYFVEKYKDVLKDLTIELWSLSEIRFQEFKSVEAITKILEGNEFEIERGVGNLPTAFRGVYGSGSPVIGLLAEYDALDGLSQVADKTEYLPRSQTTSGHGCGHHLIGTGIVGASLVLKEYLERNPGKGTVVVLGCPAEEGGSGKTVM